MRNFFSLLIVAIFGMVIGVAAMLYFTSLVDIPEPETVVEENSTVLLEKIKRVYKMVVVEGEFADILDHKEQKQYLGYTMPGFSKQLLLKVKAKVSVGYDLDNLKVTYHHDSKTIYLSNIPEPEIISIDSDITYYDLTDGMFNEFTPEELTAITAKAKTQIREQALKSSLFPAAQEQAHEMFDIITLLARENGWKVAYDMPDSLKMPEMPLVLDSLVQDNNMFYAPLMSSIDSLTTDSIALDSILMYILPPDSLKNDTIH